jgi:diguanylate cyclase (GGDEF)-like protein
MPIDVLRKIAALRPSSLVVKVYASALAGLLAVAVALCAVTYFALETRNAVLALQSDAVDRSAIVGRIDELNHQQRRSVLALVAVRKAGSAAQDRDRLRTISDEVGDLGRQANDAREIGFVRELAALAADAEAFARGEAPQPDIDERLARYLEQSDALDLKLQAAAQRRSNATRAAIDAMSDSSERMAFWISLITVAIVGVCVPMTVLWLARLLRRIGRITRTMHRIADCETAVDVPSTVDGDEVGDLARAVQAFKRNTMALQRNSDEIARLNGWFDLALDNMQRGLSIFDDDQRLVMCNDRYREIYDLPQELTRPGTPLSAILDGWRSRSVDEADRKIDVAAVLDNYRSALAEGNEFVRVHSLSNGHVVVVTYRPLPEGGWVDVHEDVTDRIQTDETIKRLAHNDRLTGLRNRTSFLDYLAGLLAERAGSEVIAVVLIDLCNFKRVNETLGHKAGDEVLKVLAQRLTSLGVAGASLARISGDGFGLVQSGVLASDAVVSAQDICARVTGPVDIDGVSVDINVSAGVALAPEHADTVDALLQRAEIALFQAKHGSHSTVEVFDPSLENALRERQALEADLKLAFDLGQLELYYQPIVDLSTRRVASFEALMRWRHPTRGMVPPTCFIPLAEELGLIVKLGQWAIEQACRDAATWPEHVGVAVNLSAAQFQTGDIHRIAYGALRAAGLAAARLELEVTESLLLRDETRTRRSLSRLKAMGVRIALDDFGTGYASLSYLRSFPFNKIKIDQTFVRDLPRDADCNAIVRSVVALARMLGMRTVAEGIETAEHLAQVLAAGCDEVQGYHFSRPVPAQYVAGVIDDCEDRLAKAA